MHQLLIIHVCGVRVVEGNDRYAVRQLESEAVHSIVNDQNLRQIFVFQDSKIFDEHIFARFVAVLTIQPIINQLLLSLQFLNGCLPLALRLRLNHVPLFLGQIHFAPELLLKRIQNCIGVGFVTCSEDDHLIIFFSLFEAVVYVRTDIDACIDALTLLKLDRNGQVVRQILDIVNAVDKCLIEVKNYCLPKL